MLHHYFDAPGIALSSLFDCLQMYITLSLVVELISLLWQAGGYFGVWTAGVAWYIAFAELLNEVWFRGRVSSATQLSVGLLFLCSFDGAMRVCILQSGL